jgi:hypothetical protein
MLTTAVLSVVILAPLGAIFMNTLGPKWLSHDEPEKEDKIKDTPEASTTPDPAPKFDPESQTPPE